jgi:hypothetical protein
VLPNPYPKAHPNASERVGGGWEAGSGKIGGRNTVQDIETLRVGMWSLHIFRKPRIMNGAVGSLWVYSGVVTGRSPNRVYIRKLGQGSRGISVLDQSAGYFLFVDHIDSVM